MGTELDFFDVGFSDGTEMTAFLTVFVLGSILPTINHGNVILSGGFARD
ncbi:MAG: hypothetical protein P8M25_05500 [Paracoccaceae bacterium]|jgi:hypothetical protein|nr:hypothetical protein [Paracoccaceae bacterium]